MEELYIAVSYPQTEELANCDWFPSECILDTKSKIRDNTYLCPLDKYNEFYNNNLKTQ
jgi:hypothetical protein